MVSAIYKLSLPFPSARDMRKDVEWDDNIHKNFAIIPDELLDGILATGGWCDLELSEDGKTVVGFTETEIPEHIRKLQEEPTIEEQIAVLAEENAALKEEKAMQAAQISALCDQMDFYEECIVEMAEVIYA